MLWRVAIHGGHLHPDFIKEKLTDRQLHELAWYFERHPYGHDIDHLMLSRVIASFAGGKPDEYMPKVNSSKPKTKHELIGGFSGLTSFMNANDIEAD